MVQRTTIDPSRFLGWGAFFAGFVPGLLQHLGGQRQRAALALASCAALFFAGWIVVGERLFYWGLAAPEGKGGLLEQFERFGLLVLPEVLNLPAQVLGAVLAFDGTPTGLRLQRMPRELEHLGAWLTGASGMLAAFWSAAGHWQLRLRQDGPKLPAVEGSAPPRAIADPALCAGLSWLVPGLGHARAGQKDKGFLMGAAVLVVFALGLAFSAGHAVDRANYGVWWIGQNLFGGGSLFAALVTGPLRSEAMPADLDLGIVLCTVAGLMNLVVMVDAYTVAERSVFPIRAAGAAQGGGEVVA